MKIVICGEAWGRMEQQMSHPLVGPTGRELSVQLGIANLAPYMQMECRKCKNQTPFIDGICQTCQERVWPNEFNLLDHWKNLRQNHGIAVTNVFNCRPFPLYRFDYGWDACEILRDFGLKSEIRHLKTGEKFTVPTKSIIQNDLGYFFSSEKQTQMPPWKASKLTPGTHLKSEFLPHIDRLYKEIETLNPNLIICLGNAACWAILGQTKITALRGTVNWSEKLNKKCLPTFHPAAVLRQPPMRVAALADLIKAAREAEFPEIRRPKRYITIPAPNVDGIKEIESWLTSASLDRCAVDIETLRRQISVIGFSRSKSDAISIPFRDANIDSAGHLIDIGRIAASIGFPGGGINYWPTPELEFQTWKLVIKILQTSSAKVFQNGIFDLTYLCKMGIFPIKISDDTMLWHHAKYLELPKSLGFLGSIYANEISWKSMRRAESLKRDE